MGYMGIRPLADRADCARIRALVDGEPEFHDYDELYRTDPLVQR